LSSSHTLQKDSGHGRAVAPDPVRHLSVSRVVVDLKRLVVSRLSHHVLLAAVVVVKAVVGVLLLFVALTVATTHLQW